VAGSATAAAASATAAAASYDSFDDRYLGAKSSAPSVDNDGNALITGAIYWNSVSNAMFAWTGSAWGSISSTADIFRYRYTASGGETSESGPDDNGLTLSYIVGKEQVYLNGVLLVRSTDYVATNGSSIASLAALTSGDILEVITFTPFEVANVISPTVIDAKGDLIVGTSADTIGKLTVGTNGFALMADSSTATGLKWGAVSTNPLTNTGSNAGDNIFAGSTTPSSPTEGDIWIDNTGSTDPDLTTMTVMGAY
jgi:membrane-associated protease RseP (regulator of RpoE activity)